MLGTDTILIEKCGRKRSAIFVACGFCKKIFPKAKKELQKRPTHFCSHECRNSFLDKKVELTCAICGTKFQRKRSRISSELAFCCREHKDLAQSFQYGLLKCGPDGSPRYRDLALRHYGGNCEWCKQSIIGILDVHHIDHDRTNDTIDNLIVLCVFCHALETRKFVVLENRRPIAISIEGQILLENLGVMMKLVS